MLKKRFLPDGTSVYGYCGKVAAGLTGIVLGLISFHAPLSVYFGTLLPDFDLLIKSWKEIVLCLAAVLFIPLAIKSKVAEKMLRDKLFILIGIFTLLHGVILFVLYQGLLPTLAGLAIDLRYLLFFTLVYALVLWRPNLRSVFVKTILLASIVVIVFGFLQIVLLPRDILSEIGYSKASIAPYLSVDENPAYIRINSSLRGPNPLGLYMAGWLTIVLAFFAAQKPCSKIKKALLNLRQRFSLGWSGEQVKWQRPVFAALFLMALVVLWHSYSRSSLLAAAMGMVIVLVIIYKKELKRHFMLAGFLIIVACAVVFVTFQNNSVFQHVIFHNDPYETNLTNSDQGHAASLQSAWRDFSRQPLGAGVGSTGSASLLGDKPNIIENQYLFVAHETGWLGVGLFVIIFGLVLRRLIIVRKNYLSLGLFAGGVGLAVAGLVLPVFADDTIAILWWGLAAIALASKGEASQL